MAAFRFSRTEESQVDPFNAGDPVLPGGEPEALAEADEPEGQVEYMAHGESGGTPHKPGDNYQAPTTRGHDYDAPSIDEPSRSARTRPRRSRTAPATPTAPESEVGKRTEKDRRVVTSVIVLLVILVSFGSSLVSCAVGLVGSAADGIGSAVESLGDVFFEDDDADERDDYVPEQDADDESAAAALEARLDELLADPASGELHDRVAAYLDEKMLTIEGYHASELGLDADALATFVLEGLGAEASFAYAFDDGTGSAYAEVTALSANELFWALNDAFGDYLLDNDLWGRDVALPDDAQRAHVAAAAEEVLASFAEPETSTYVFLLERTGDVWTVNAQDLDDTVVSILGLY